MKLYELSGNYRELYDGIDDLEDEDLIQAFFDTLEGIEEEFEIKAENIACFIKNLKAEAEAIKTEKLKLEKRQKSKENLAKRLQNNLMQSMDYTDIKKIDTAKCYISITKPREVVEVIDMDKLDKKYKRISFAPDKTTIKAAIKSGQTVDGAIIKLNPSLIIK